VQVRVRRGVSFEVRHRSTGAAPPFGSRTCSYFPRRLLKMTSTTSPEHNISALPELLDVRGVAALLGCSPRHVYRLADVGKMPAPVRLGRWCGGGGPPCRVGRGWLPGRAADRGWAMTGNALSTVTALVASEPDPRCWRCGRKRRRRPWASPNANCGRSRPTERAASHTSSLVGNAFCIRFESLRGGLPKRPVRAGDDDANRPESDRRHPEGDSRARPGNRAAGGGSRDAHGPPATHRERLLR